MDTGVAQEPNEKRLTCAITQLHDHEKFIARYEVPAYNVIYLVYISILLETPTTNMVDWLQFRVSS